ncbi:MAG TPA: TonB-dependent receptor [Bacteroidia bacterium]|nr:TonB-dependent receptor [Bacteroidia bacterium]
MDKGLSGMKKSGSTYFILFVVWCANVFAQQKDTLHLSEVTVTDYRSKISSQNFAETKIDSATKNNFSTGNVAQMLLQQNVCLVKSYGPANIAFLSVRGSTAQQTAVVWNGMNINNPMLGQADVSLLPVGFFNSISLQKGALSGYWGSGAMAGVLNLQSAAQNTGLTIKASTSYSSLQNSSQWASVNFSSGKWSSATRILADVSQNKYQFYSNADSLKRQTQTHAQTTQYAFMQDAGFKINARQQLGLHIWLQDAQRKVPYTLGDIKDDASQHDKILRAMLDWKLLQNKYAITARTAFVNEELIYTNQTSSISSDNIFKTFLFDLETQFYLLKGFTITAGNSNSISVGNSEGYAKQQQLSRMALFQNISWRYSKASASVFGRQELFNLNAFVPTGGVSLSLQALKWLSCKVNAGTVYRYPTLNDLYWNPGGNPDLKPEKGFSQESSLQINYVLQKFSFSITGTVFNRIINDWIMWLPGKNGIWSPQNVLQVWSRGGETNSEISYKGKDVKFSVNVLSNYVLSTRTKTTLQNDESEGKQLAYVPMYSGSAVFSVEYKNTSLRTVYSYTGYRYLTSDNYNYLNPYSLLDIRVGRTFFLKNSLINVFMEVNNLLNENYFSVAQYPMPLRNFKTGIIFQYQKQNKKQNI